MDNPREAPSQATLAYVAGIVDGEGTVIVSKVTKARKHLIAPTYTVWLRVGNTNEELVRYLNEVFPGAIVARRIVSNKWKQCFVWQVTGIRVRDTLRLLRPYLRVKAAQADLIDEYYAGFHSFMKAGRHGTLSPEQLAHRESCYMRMKSLNQKGAPAETEREDSSRASAS